MTQKSEFLQRVESRGAHKDRSLFKVGDVVLCMNRVNDYTFVVDNSWLNYKFGDRGSYFSLATPKERNQQELKELSRLFRDMANGKVIEPHGLSGVQTRAIEAIRDYILFQNK
jgi:hypothetical protein